MTVINGTSLALVDSFSDTTETLLDGTLHVASADLNGVTHLYVSSELGDAIEVFTLAADGTLSNLGRIESSADDLLDRPWDMRSFQVGGTDFLAVVGTNDDAVSIYALSDTAPFLTKVDSIDQSASPNLNLTLPFGVEIVETASGTFLYVAGDNSNGISSFEVASDGTLTSVENVDDGVNIAIAGAIDINSFELSGSHYLAVAGFDDDGVSVFEVAADGTLTHIDDRSGIPTANGPWESDVVTIGDTAYLYLSGYFSNAVTALAFNGTSLSTIGAVASGVTLQGARATEVLDFGSNKSLAVLPAFGTGLQLYEIETDPLSGTVGTFSPQQSVSGPTFVGSGDVQTVFVGGTPFLIATSGEAAEGYVNVLSIGGGADVLDGTSEADTINGRGGDDIITALGGDDVIDGGDGDDTIMAGDGMDTVIASAGMDSTDGGEGYDTFVTSNFDDETTGLRVDLNNGQVILADGTEQDIAGFERIFGTNRDDVLIGDDGDNDINGDSGDDLLRGKEGDDMLRGNNGSDRVIGGSGNDQIFGGNGNDEELNGSGGEDIIYGEIGDDALYGGFGNDFLSGGAGADTMRGNRGDDVMSGGGSDDLMRGGNNNDTLFGNSGNDFLSGDGGLDRLNGGSGDDALVGGAAADVFEFRTIENAGGGFNKVKDFTDGEDRLDVTDYGLDIAGLTALAEQKSWGTRIELSDGQVIALEGFMLTDLDASDLF